MVHPHSLAARLLSAAVALALCPVAAATATPIADSSPTTLAMTTGTAVRPHPLSATVAPRNPFLAPAPDSNIHDDTWMTDAIARPGPVGLALQPTSFALPLALCGSLAFDSHGRIVSICPSRATATEVRVIDRLTGAVVSTYPLPGGPNVAGPGQFQNFTGGGYFFLDGRDRVWTATKTNHLMVIGEQPQTGQLTLRADYDLSRAITGDERITSALPDFDGNLWFVSKQDGKVGVLDRRSGHVAVVRLGEEIENSFAVDRDAVYIVSDKRMYRFSVRDGAPHVDWRVTYANSAIAKPGQVDAGSGTTPTIMRGGYVAITDNADPMNVVVYRTTLHLHGQRRVVCQVPVFDRGASATENSLITAGRSLFVENNYGYQDPFGPTAGAVTTPGFARVDVNRRGTGCARVWTNRDVRAPTVVTKLSTATGLLYTYERPAAPAGEQPYFWAAIDARTGRTVWTRYAGSGLLFNNNYAGIAIGPDDALYLGVIGGIVRLADGGVPSGS
jgi:outer membrane protein assembly factor BamB